MSGFLLDALLYVPEWLWRLLPTRLRWRATARWVAYFKDLPRG